MIGIRTLAALHRLHPMMQVAESVGRASIITRMPEMPLTRLVRELAKAAAPQRVWVPGWVEPTDG